MATFSSSTIKEQKRNPFQDFNSPRFSSTKEGEGACIQNVPRATWIILWDVFKRNESGQRESFAQTKILASTDFNFRTEWFHSKVNEQRVYIYKFPKYFPPNESLSSSRYVQGVSQKIFVNSNNPLRVTAFFVNEVLLTKKYRNDISALATTEHKVRTSSNNTSKKVPRYYVIFESGRSIFIDIIEIFKDFFWINLKKISITIF